MNHRHIGWMLPCVVALGCGDSVLAPPVREDLPDGGTSDVFERDCSGGSLVAPTPGCAPEVLPTTGDIYQDCVTRINQLRWECQCLPSLERWTEAEACTDDNAAFDSQNGAHASFGLGQCGATGWVAQNECPRPSTDSVLSDCFQAMWDEGPGGGHYENMTSENFARVACGFYFEPGGGVYATQNFD